MYNFEINKLNDELKTVNSAERLAKINSKFEIAQWQAIELTKENMRREIAITNANVAQEKYLKQEIQMIKEQNYYLKQQLNNSIISEKQARKEAKHSRMLSYITIGIAFASLIATILIAVLK